MSRSIQKNMSLSQLLAGLIDVSLAREITITGISEFSGDVESGDLFIALGASDYSSDAISLGAVAVICESGAKGVEKHTHCTVPIIECENLAYIKNEIIQRFYQGLTKQISTIAITGTDGKSSVAHLVAQALELSGEACGLIGTLGYGRLQNLLPSTHTTPPQSRLAKEYKRLNDAGCRIVALEASSHGIHQNRLRDLSIHTAVLTNITRDHLDYHKTIDAYIQAKAALFFNHHAQYAVINIDDQVGCKWHKELSSILNAISYSLNDPHADVYATNIEYLHSATAVRISVRGQEIELHTTLLGEFNVLNILAVVAVLVCQQKTTDEIALIINKLDAVPGRMQCVGEAQSVNVIVDYAHTPAALLAALKAVRKHCAGKLICVFGCGGDRDQGKRAQMGETAVKNADYVIITSDNPRKEPPEFIIQQILAGCESADNYTHIIDRKQAIIFALNQAEENDAVLIAGKGHEKYQYINDQVIAFDDVTVASEELQRIAHV